MSEKFPKVTIGKNADLFDEAYDYFDMHIGPHIPESWSNSTGGRDIGFEWSNDNDPDDCYIFQVHYCIGLDDSLVITGLIYDQYTGNTLIEGPLDSQDSIERLFASVS